MGPNQSRGKANWYYVNYDGPVLCHSVVSCSPTNIGDMLINPRLHAHIRVRTRERMVQQSIAIDEKRLGPWTPLDVGAKPMKVCLMKWVKEWMEKETTEAASVASWRMVHTAGKVAETVDAMRDPLALILLPPPLFPLTALLAHADDFPTDKGPKEDNINVASSEVDSEEVR